MRRAIDIAVILATLGGIALAGYLVTGCGAAAHDHAAVATGEACVVLQEHIVESGHPDREARFECVAAVCGEVMDRLAEED